ncbi:MAG TPA: fibronectin type III domain-containing protein [Nitriliruptorales bacterium]|nr:fibronectin type III domain-containing protein [Nitriliruptorales bacterium]
MSKAPDRSAPVSLDGTTVTGSAYVYVATDTGVRRVSFWVDDPAMSTTPYQVEKAAPFDLAGTASDGTALAYDTTALADGSHTVTAKVQPTKGAATVVSATFTVDNLTPGLAFSPSSLSFALDVDGAATSQPVDLTVDTADPATFVIEASATWLTASPATGTAPTLVSVTADPTGLAAGTYTGTLTASSSGLTSGTLSVTATVGDTGGCEPVDCSSLVATPSSRSLSATAGGGATSAPVDVSTSDGSTPTVSLTTDQGWLSVSPTNLTAPATITVTADPTGLAAGNYSGTVTASTTGYSDLSIPVSFTVGGETPYTLLLSAASDRSTPRPLQGQAVSANVYIFTGPDDGVSSVDFYVDNPAMSGTPTKTENNAPFDLGGTNTTTRLANAYDTTKLADGSHTLTAAMRLTDGTTRVVEAAFTVDNVAGGALGFGRTSTSMAAIQGGSPISEAVRAVADDLSAQPMTVSSDAAWLTVSPTSGTTPLDVNLTADPTGLAEGAHTATVVARANDPAYSGATLTVTLHVRPSLAPDQVHLAWEQDPSTTLTVVWRTWDDDTPSTVEYRQATSSQWQTVTGSRRPSGTAGHLHQATLTGLQPGTSYQYRLVGDHQTPSEVFNARTAPGVGGAFNVVFVADTGIDGRTDGLTTGTRQVRDEIAAMGPDLVLAGGDFAYFNTETRFATLDDAIDAWFDQMQPIASRAPTMPAYGNHEILLSEGFEPWAARFPTPQGHDGRRSYSFDVGDVHFVSILHVKESGALSQSQLNWITNDIAAAKAAGARWIIPFMHGSLYTDGANHPANADVRAQLAPLFESAGVPLVLSTHDQAFERSYPLVDMPTTNTRTSTSLTCYQLGVDGTVWVKSSPGGKLSNKNAGFSPFKSDRAPSWTAIRDNRMHNFAHLSFGVDGGLTVTTYGVVGDGTPATLLDRFRYTPATCQ